MSALTIISEAVASLDEGFQFLYAGYPEQNLNDDADFPVAYLMPLNTLDDLPKYGGVINAKYQVAIYLGELSKPEWSLQQHDDNCIEPMRQASLKLISAFVKDNRIKEVRLKNRNVIINKDDVNTSGIWLECELTMTEQLSLCS